MTSNPERLRAIRSEQYRRYGRIVARETETMVGVTRPKKSKRDHYLPRSSKKPVTLPKLRCLEDE